ncbi:nuclear transport factor 2 family protein [Neorhizobium alkalisoli]|jgi:ketosteroid isomerase-like protein|uniref:Ketosteroid isomerase-like protein n=1 Tax=Neorhizobium alkalisoli TaxID=528178 RepID=A0A561R3L5_9HYPH|nr:nuclear transport factor 2 family protein [Neorhizobium alkalisoli]TWF57181.1 ketosteroid isomerase-like protein [Neorhizobium alkalisoli]
MKVDPVELAWQFHEAINAIDFAAIEEFFAEDATYVSNGVGDLKGRAEIMAAIRGYFADYPDQEADDELIELVSPMAARAVWSLTATHSGTGKPLERRGEETITFNEEGRVVRVEVTDYQAF